MSDAATPESDWFDVDEALDFLRISRATLYRLIKRGDVKAFKLGGQLRFRRADLLAAVKPVPPSDPA